MIYKISHAKTGKNTNYVFPVTISPEIASDHIWNLLIVPILLLFSYFSPLQTIAIYRIGKMRTDFLIAIQRDRFPKLLML